MMCIKYVQNTFSERTFVCAASFLVRTSLTTYVRTHMRTA